MQLVDRSLTAQGLTAQLLGEKALAVQSHGLDPDIRALKPTANRGNLDRALARPNRFSSQFLEFFHFAPQTVDLGNA